MAEIPGVLLGSDPLDDRSRRAPLDVRHWDDLAIILVLLVFNAGVGFWQEFKAANALAALKQKLAPKVRAARRTLAADRRYRTWRCHPAAPGRRSCSVRRRVVFLEDYNMSVAAALV